MNNDISTLITETIKSIQVGLPEGFEITDDIKFEVNVVTEKLGKGGMDIKLLNANSEKKDSLSHKITFEVAPKIDREKKMNDDFKTLEGIISKGASVFNSFKHLFEGNDQSKLAGKQNGQTEKS
ncbi:hypothetical protein LAG90_00825 [Marinilongibacter aquaticus]|uniref:hypothetical protein n=1 Tax=Marinilongibacter aquaticus TaxID=2975157 RepID=UPI0021BD4A17|nr:hypothetical protein [Marinilongibacter aquaticus]UBM59202.1 hypothetical protein LAG90_00825 [Marinilongibacter aquaticus]